MSVFVGNLSFQTKWWTLKDHFKQVGEVVHVDIFTVPGKPHLSSGCGLVQFKNQEDADNALTLDNTELDGRVIRVKKDEFSPRGRQVFVGNLNFRTTSQTLKEAFEKAVGSVEKAVVARDPKQHTRSLGHGIVRFATPELAEKAIELMNDKEVDGRTVLVKMDDRC
ncbi:hypothetical protein C9374_014619 [Naegleria lovaniensis]|uniref:RRM domain-containing protein n=1 Tax=Naegleria lovaniensis TaxID=51637 RepID=A0AA88H0C4_NAELO|nr:uncharacterized protein C9374_014619 [Naegleria lovaniensis]KAG2389219.1 hypothetical protein C9374_014619 [Naegleria lovaniensis]